MKNVMKLTLAGAAALALTVAGAAYACDHESAAKAGSEAKAGCSHGDAAKAEGGCTHGAKAEVVKDSAEGCPYHSKATDTQRAALEKGTKVTLVGRVVCANCDLNQAKECKSVFKTDGGDLYAIVGNEAFDKLAGETKHGEKHVEIQGTTAKDADESIVLLASYKVLG